MSTTSKMLTLKTSDNETFEVEEQVACMSETIKHMVEDDCAEDNIPLPNVTGKVLAKVLEYCNKHAESSDSAAAASDDADAEAGAELKKWDKDFLDVDQAQLYDLILAANYLNIQSLLGSTCQQVADMIKGKTPEQIRKTFNIKNDFSPEEEQEIRSENQWAFES